MNDWQCPLCKSCECDWLFDSTDLMGATCRTFAVVRCRRCSLFSLQPRPQRDELLSLYSQDYEPFWRPLDEELNWLLRWMRWRHYAYRCQAVHRAQPFGGSLLDVGCGTGGFLRELCRDSSWKGVGVDINEYALAVARRQGVSVRCGELSDASLPSASFDAVTMWEVIEHVLDPWGTLSEVHRILKPEGGLLLSTPNGESWQARLWGKHWAGWTIPFHLQVFSPQTLRQLLEEKGFQVVRRFSFPMERFFAVESARRWLQVYARNRFQATAQRLTWLAGLAAWPVFRLIDQMPSATSIVLEARPVS